MEKIGLKESFLTEVSCEAGDVSLIDEHTAERMAETFKVLSDPTRVRIISALAGTELCVHELVSLLDMTQSAISHQLALLRELHLVATTKEGRRVIYRLDDEHIADLFHQGLEHLAHT